MACAGSENKSQLTWPQQLSVVSLEELFIPRRSFLKAAALGLAVVPRSIPALASMLNSQVPIERGQFGQNDVGWVRDELLKLINTERSAAGLNELQLDELASRVANEHAADMVRGEFLSHWGSDGLKPYQRYSFAGGIDAVQENVSAADNIASVSAMRVFSDLQDMHTRMHDEVPPNDGHRLTILTPQTTHVGLGVALKGHSLRLAEMYLSRYLELDPFPQQSQRKGTVTLSGRLLNSGWFLHEVDVFYEPLAAMPDSAWLRTPRPYSLPAEYVWLRPKAPTGTTYADGTTGNYEWSKQGKFRVPVKLSKDAPGIYTVLFWIRRVPAEKGFPAAQVCIRCE